MYANGRTIVVCGMTLLDSLSHANLTGFQIRDLQVRQIGCDLHYELGIDESVGPRKEHCIHGSYSIYIGS